MELVLEYLANVHPYARLILNGLGAAVVMGQAYVALTPSTTDDTWVAALESKAVIGPLFKALRSFAPIQKK